MGMNRAQVMQAACSDNEEAYALAFSKNINEQYQMINLYCDECPIRLSCLAMALELDAYGVWGGRTRKARVEMKQLIDAYS